MGAAFMKFGLAPTTIMIFMFGVLEGLISESSVSMVSVFIGGPD